LNLQWKKCSFYLVVAVSFSPFCFGSERSSSVRATSLDFSHRPVGLVPVVISFSHPRFWHPASVLASKIHFAAQDSSFPLWSLNATGFPANASSVFYSVFFLGCSAVCLPPDFVLPPKKLLPAEAIARSWFSSFLFVLLPAGGCPSFPLKGVTWVSLIFPIEIPVPHEFSDRVFSLPLIWSSSCFFSPRAYFSPLVLISFLLGTVP
jgi:hypothetical protein